MSKLPKQIQTNHERFNNYKDNKNLFKGKAWDVFGIQQYDYYKKINSDNPQLSYINFNYFGILTRSLADLIWNGGVDVKLKNNQEWFDAWRERSNFDIKGYEAVLSSSYNGDAVFKLSIDSVKPGSKDHDIQLYQVNPSIWYPDFDADNPSRPVNSHTLLYTKKINEDKGTAYLLEIYSYGKIAYESYYTNGESNGDEGANYVKVDPYVYFGDELKNVLVNSAKLESGLFEYDTQLDTPLVVHIPNFSLPDEFFGLSDYTDDIKSTVYAINDGYTSIESVRKKHIDPMLVVPESVIKQAMREIESGDKESLKDNGFSSQKAYSAQKSKNLNAVKEQIAARILQKTKIMGMSAGEGNIRPEYITWDAKLEAAFNQIKELKTNLALQSELSPVLTNPDQKIGSLTGIAIKRLAAPTLNKAQRKAMYLKKGLEELILTALKLAYKSQSITGEYKPKSEDDEVTVEIRENLVEDIMEVIEKNERLISNSLTTQVDAMIEIFDYTKEQAEAKVKEINDEVKAKLPFEEEVEDDEDETNNKSNIINDDQEEE